MKPIKTLLSDCDSGWGCRKSELQSSLTCDQSNGHACLKALLNQRDFDEKIAYNLEVFENSKMNVIDQEKGDDNDFEIVAQPAVEDDDEEEET